MADDLSCDPATVGDRLRRVKGEGAGPPLGIPAAAARRLVLHLQGLADPPRRRLTAAGLLELILRLGFLQVDSISTVERAHHMILFARNEAYRPALLARLLEDERQLFEHWAHRVAAILPMRFYPWWQVRFAREQAAIEETFRRWQGEGVEGELARVHALIREGGPILARDLAPERGRPAGGWWDWHDGKAALELLWRSGRLAIAGRAGFQKIYDLPERVIPEAARGEPPAEAAMIDWACRAALERLGFATPSEIARFFGLVTIAEAAAWCAREDGGAIPARLEGMDGTARKVVARPDLPELLAALPAPPGRMRALNPFDPVLRDRARLQRLFGFDYRIEVFVPAPRRRYGYYVFPLLDGERLVGRIDMRADRTRGDLVVTALWPEPGCRFGAGRMQRLEAELERLRRFAGLDAVRFVDGWLGVGG
jgi:uncharacterized protein